MTPELRPIESYRDLIAWQRAMDFVADIYTTTNRFPASERYGLASQLRRSAVSIPSNIAEGQGYLSKGEFKQFLGNARGSLLELETQLLIAKRLDYIHDEQCTKLLRQSAELGRILNGLINALWR
jgi:four helix bundle protein